jgi:hypothetical protein
MPNRILREGILTSSRIARLSGWADEVFYRRLMSVVDDFGRYYADYGLLRAACYPRQLSKVSDSDIGKWISACETAALVRVYPASDGERYLQLLDFRQQVRAGKSKFPDPLSECEADATQTQINGEASAPVFVFEDVSVSVVGGVSCGAAPSAPPPPVPAAKEFNGSNLEEIPSRNLVTIAVDWALPETWGLDAEKLGWEPRDIEHEAEKFRQYWVAGRGQGTRRSLKSWRSTWSNWLAKAAERKR